jgi:hypothetical protein
LILWYRFVSLSPDTPLHFEDLPDIQMAIFFVNVLIHDLSRLMPQEIKVLFRFHMLLYFVRLLTLNKDMFSSPQKIDSPALNRRQA